MLQCPSKMGFQYNELTLIHFEVRHKCISLAGYSDTRIQKMGSWCGATFKEYIREELACFSQGMSTNMKQNFKFVNIAGNTFHDIMENVVLDEYNTL